MPEDTPLVVALPQRGVGHVVEVQSGGLADGAAAVDHHDAGVRVALAEGAGDDRAHDPAAHDEDVGAVGVGHAFCSWEMGVATASAGGTDAEGRTGPKSSVSIRSRTKRRAPTRGPSAPERARPQVDVGARASAKGGAEARKQQIRTVLKAAAEDDERGRDRPRQGGEDRGHVAHEGVDLGERVRLTRSRALEEGGGDGALLRVRGGEEAHRTRGE